jgi:hypothetical protein
VRFPSTLLSLKLGVGFLDYDRPNQLDLPAGLTRLRLGGPRHALIDWKLPVGLRSLSLAHRGSPAINGWKPPATLERLNFGSSFNVPITGVVWPHALTALEFGFLFNQPLSGVDFPPSLQSLTFGSCFRRSLMLRLRLRT